MALQPAEKHCWVCFATEQDDPGAEWLSPCGCRGSTKWVHLSCLQYWLDTRLRVSQQPIRCQLCEVAYSVIFPQMGPLVDFLQVVDRTLTAIGPYGTLGLLVGTAYWTALSYGAMTVVQVMGQANGLTAMRAASPLLLLSGLPAIPALLILGKTVRWNDCVMKLWQKCCYEPKLPPGLLVLYCGLSEGALYCLFLTAVLVHTSLSLSLQHNRQYLPPIPLDEPRGKQQLLTSRKLCGALMFPSIAVLTGRLLFPSVTSHLQRTLLGGSAYVLLKGVVKVYFTQQLFIMHASRRILNYGDVQRAERRGN